MTAPAALVGTVLDGKFQIQKALASGAAGDVYEAVHLGLGSRVAVKVLRPCTPETAGVRRKRFVREARVAARIQSDHVVRVFDIVAPEEGLTYIVMELLQGETLQERVRRCGGMPVEEALDYILQAAKPLAEMHDAGIVHRDVKPSNVFLARDADGKERIKLLDFGVAAFQQPVTPVARSESSLTFTDAIVGTPRYMAPEQVRAAKNVDARADVWALGVTLYELLAGAPPFDGQTVLAVLNQIERQEPPPLAKRRPDLDAELAAVIHRCLAKNPNERPADARAVARALGPFVEAAPASRADPLDLSLSDENVEVIAAGLSPMTLRARVTAAATRNAVAATLVLGACGLAVLLFAMLRATHDAGAAPDGRAIPAAVRAGAIPDAPATAAPPAPSPPPAPSAATRTTPAASAESPREATVARRAPEAPASHPPAPHGHSAKPSARPSGKPATRASEDDDRIE